MKERNLRCCGKSWCKRFCSA